MWNRTISVKLEYLELYNGGNKSDEQYFELCNGGNKINVDSNY